MAAFGVLLLMLAAELGGLSVKVVGETVCPSSASVEAELRGLVLPKDGSLPPDIAELRADGDSVAVSLRRPDGDRAGEKVLARDLPCAERARAAAVIIAAWEARLATEASAPILDGEAPPIAEVAPPSAPAAPPNGAPAAQVEAVERTRPAPRAPEPPSQTPRIRPGIGLQVSATDGSSAPAAAIEVAVERPGRPLVPMLAGLVVGSHSTAVGPGEATWRRIGIAAGLAFHKPLSALWLEVRLSADLTVLLIDGHAFPRDASGTTFDPGVSIGLRVGLEARPVAPWIEVGAAFWPRAQTLYLSGAADSSRLPLVEALFGIGISYARR